MGESSPENIRIAKLKGTENWASWYDNIKCTLILRNLWKYIEGRDSIEPVAPTALSPRSEASVQEKFEKDTVAYEEKLDKWKKSQGMIMAIIKLSCEIDIKFHLKNVKNGTIALNILRNLFGGTDLSIIDISYREITRSNLENFSGIEAYSLHLKRHRENIIKAGKNIPDWLMASAFRMGLPARLNPYVFGLVHTAKTSGKVLTFDEMVTALVAEEKRSDY